MLISDKKLLAETAKKNEERCGHVDLLQPTRGTTETRISD
jgi:hypothetical protein